MIKYLVLGPGGMAYFATLGRVVRLHEQGMFKNLEEISGSSAGAVCAFCYLLFRNKIQDFVDVSFSMKTDKILTFKIKNLLKKYGGIDLKHARHSLSELCTLSLGISDVDFKTFYDLTGVKLHIPAYSFTKGTNIYFSPDMTPSFSVIDAVCASISIPIIMAPYMGEYLDGSMIEEIPYIPFLSKNIDDVLCIRIDSGDYFTEDDTFTGYLKKLVNILYSLRRTCTMYKIDYVRIESTDYYKFSMSTDVKMKMFIQGYSSSLS